MPTSRRSTKQQESGKLGMSLRQVGIERAAFCEMTKSLQMQVTAERQNSEQLHHELSTTKAKEAALITQLEKQKAAVPLPPKTRYIQQIQPDCSNRLPS
jgi:hypothetical protein